MGALSPGTTESTGMAPSPSASPSPTAADSPSKPQQKPGKEEAGDAKTDMSAAAAAKRIDVELATTGMTGFDAQFGGGIPQGALYLITSSPTTATSTFLAQLAAGGLQEGETVYYFSLEHPADEVEQAITRFLKDPDDAKRLKLIDGYPRQFRDVPKEARKRLDIPEGEDLLAALEHLLVDPGLKSPVRIVIESLSELVEQYPTDRVFRIVRVLRAVMRRLPGIAAMTLVSDLHDARTIALAKHLCDGVVEFHVERKGFGIYPYIAVTKMRGVTGSARLLLFKETDQGLWLESTKRVY